MKLRRVWFVRTTTLVSPFGQELVIASRFKKLVAVYLDGRYLTPNEFRFYARTWGIEL